MPNRWTHLDEKSHPQMVDVGAKAVTSRSAQAQAEVYLPPPIIQEMEVQGELRGPKGPVFQTAIVAGVQGAKRTWELIPLCHQIPLEKCRIEIEIQGPQTVLVTCTAAATHKTGVEMEALTGATLAALTIHDMCKALSPAIEIRRVRLLEKKGGTHDFNLPPP